MRAHEQEDHHHHASCRDDHKAETDNERHAERCIGGIECGERHLRSCSDGDRLADIHENDQVTQCDDCWHEEGAWDEMHEEREDRDAHERADGAVLR